jgi:Family of unknown function (DUF5695)
VLLLFIFSHSPSAQNQRANEQATLPATLAPLGLWLTLDSGTFARIDVNRRTRLVRVGLSPATTHTSAARLRVEQTAKIAGVGKYGPRRKLLVERQAYKIPLTANITWIDLVALFQQ